MKSSPTDGELLGARPRRAAEWREEDGVAVLLRPKLGRGRLGRRLAACLRDPYYRIRLDDVGTFVWRAANGTTRADQIAGQLRDRFGSRAESAEAQLCRFLRQLRRAGLIEL